jgi:hypothetical protein
LIALIVQTASDGGGEGLKVVLPLIGSAIALFGVLITLYVNGRRAERTRRRDLYSAGWAAVQAYKEMAFAIRRRNREDRAAERVRLSEAMSEIQKDLAYHEAMIGRERVSETVFLVTGQDLSGAVGDAYSKLVAETRKVAGGIIKRSWDEAPISSDSEMHAPSIAEELRALKPVEDEFLDAVNADVGGRRPDSR